MALKSFICPCGRTAAKEAGAVNRAERQGLQIYCSRECAWLHHRKNKTPEQKKEEKRLYDMEYRSKNRELLKEKKAAYYRENRELLKEKKAAYYRENHNIEKEREQRKKRSAQHVQYCQRPEYRMWKKGYDRQYRAKKFYGEFAECHLLVLSIRDECLERMDDRDIRNLNGTLNKKQERRRDYDRT